LRTMLGDGRYGTLFAERDALTTLEQHVVTLWHTVYQALAETREALQNATAAKEEWECAYNALRWSVKGFFTLCLPSQDDFARLVISGDPRRCNAAR
jgi:hypothetical protein